MSMREVAKHLSAMGRHGDSMLVHMSPDEVKALHGIGSLTGSEITINPKTGLPEAFSFGDFFKSLLPTIVGAVAAPLTGGGSLIPVLAGAATGAALNRDNPLMGAFTGGIGGFGGAGIGGALGKSALAGTTPSITGGAANAASTAANAANAANAAGTLSNVASPLTEGTLANAIAQPGVMGSGALNAGFPQGVAGGVQGMVGGPSGVAELSTGLKTAQTAAAPSGLSSLGAGIKNLGTEAGRSAFTEALGGTGPNSDLIAAGKVALPVGMGALSAIEPPKLPEEEKYDPSFRLDLSGDSGLRFFAEGGSVFETPDSGSNPIQDAQDARSYGIGGLSYAKGGNVQRFNDLGDMIGYVKNNQGLFGNNASLFGGSSLNLNDTDAVPQSKFDSFRAMMNRSFEQPQTQNANSSAFSVFRRPNQTTQMPPQQTPGIFGQNSQALFAKGGYLDGPGDGMSDSIPATIEGKQPARLADGEFVVPADVVSHLGNGSTKAGAQHLYAMMDKVRKARTGTKKQGKQINPKKFIPA